MFSSFVTKRAWKETDIYGTQLYILFETVNRCFNDGVHSLLRRNRFTIQSLIESSFSSSINACTGMSQARPAANFRPKGLQPTRPAICLASSFLIFSHLRCKRSVELTTSRAPNGTCMCHPSGSKVDTTCGYGFD